MENQSTDVILDKIIENSFQPEFILNTSKVELKKRALGILLAEIANNEGDTIVEIAAIAMDESGWENVARDLRKIARQLDH